MLTTHNNGGHIPTKRNLHQRTNTRIMKKVICYSNVLTDMLQLCSMFNLLDYIFVLMA